MILINKLKIVMAVIAILLIPGLCAGQPQFRKEVAPPPRLIPGGNVTLAAANAINLYIYKMMKILDKDVMDCKNAAEYNAGWWERVFDHPYSGAGYYSILIKDDIYCGGAHPSQRKIGLIFDSVTGHLIDPAIFLKKYGIIKKIKTTERES